MLKKSTAFYRKKVFKKGFHAGQKLSYTRFFAELSRLLNGSGIEFCRQEVRAQAGINRGKKSSGTQGSSQKSIGRVEIFIDQHLAEQLSLEMLASEARLSKYQLIRLFRNEKGATPWKYLVEKRIEKAMEMLENGDAPAKAAAEAGFYDQSHLNKVFKEETGMTPKEYQNKQKEKERARPDDGG